MPQVDVAFEKSKVYDVAERIDVMPGEKFTLLTDYENGKWFFDNDPVLSSRVNGKDVEITAEEVGHTTVLIMDANFAIQKKLSINVLEAILPPATDLGITAGSPEPK